MTWMTQEPLPRRPRVGVFRGEAPAHNAATRKRKKGTTRCGSCGRVVNAMTVHWTESGAACYSCLHG